MEYEGVQQKLLDIHGKITEIEAALAVTRKSLVGLSFSIGVPTAASSPQKPDEPSAESTCEAGESAPECSGAVAGQHKWLTECDYCGEAKSAPPADQPETTGNRKVWAVQRAYGPIVGLFASGNAAYRYVRDSAGGEHRVAEYEVADG